MHSRCLQGRRPGCAPFAALPWSKGGSELNSARRNTAEPSVPQRFRAQLTSSANTTAHLPLGVVLLGLLVLVVSERLLEVLQAPRKGREVGGHA